MKKRILTALFAVTLLFSLSAVPALAATETHTVVPGDTLWKLSVRYKLRLDDVIAGNPQFKDPNLIYPGDKVYLWVPDGTTNPGTGSGTGNGSLSSFEQEVVNLVNAERQKNGLSPLTVNAQLAKSARAKSQDMHDKNYFSHQSPTYGSPFDMMKKFGISYRTAGENIAKGQTTPAAVMKGWMNSSGHRANILNKSFTQIGVGYVADGHYWTQQFIG